jgi:hypothetical protein
MRRTCKRCGCDVTCTFCRGLGRSAKCEIVGDAQPRWVYAAGAVHSLRGRGRNHSFLLDKKRLGLERGLAQVQRRTDNLMVSRPTRLFSRVRVPHLTSPLSRSPMRNSPCEALRHPRPRLRTSRPLHPYVDT